MPVFELNDKLLFPPPDLGREDGLLALGGDLSTERLHLAYRQGIFPWYNEGQPVLWWCPDPRFVLFPEKLNISKSMRPVLRNKGFRVTFNRAFEHVIDRCKKVSRKGQAGTWITKELKEAFVGFHREGWAHSVEVWQDGEIVGGLYGVAMGKCFFGESMYTEVSNASKVGFIRLVQLLQKRGVEMIDCQVYTEHLESMGAKLIPRAGFLKKLRQLVGENPGTLKLEMH